MAGALLLLGLSGCAVNPVTGDQNFVMFSEDSELAIGRTNHPKIIEQYGRYEDEALQRYVQSVGEKVAAVSHRPDLVYRFTVLDSSVINAFALPGGYIYITRGLMAYLNSEAELAAVLGHEIGHVTARHGVRQQSAAQAANLGYTLGSIFFPELRGAGSQNVFNILGGALLSGYGREHELESDRLGAEYLAKSNYDPQAMIDVIRVLKNQSLFAEAEAEKLGQSHQGYHGLFASHPDNDTRLHQVVSEADKYKRVGQQQVAREAYLNKINGMVFGDSEDEGIRSQNHFYHLALGLSVTFPEQWHIKNNSNSVQAIAPKGVALIEMSVTDINRKLSPREFISKRLDIDDLMQGRVLNQFGLEGYTGITTYQGNPLRIAVVYKQTQAFLFFAGTERKSEFARFDKTFLEAIGSFQALNDKDIPLAKALKIQIQKVSSTDTYERWAKQTRISNSPKQQLRLLNDHYPDGELLNGQWAKQVQ
jgi:predicted Zn-dependent protease